MRAGFCAGAATLVTLAIASPVAAQAPRAPVSRTVPEISTRIAEADAAYASGDRERAEREYAAIVADDSSQSRAVFRLAQLRERRDRGEAIALYRRYVALQPSDPWGWLALGDALGAAGSLSDALSQYDRAERLAPGERDVHVGRARLLARTGRTDDAITAYERWLASTPSDAEAWRELAAQRRRAGRYDEEASALKHVAALDAAPAARSKATRDLERARTLSAATVEPRVIGSRDSDGLTTTGAGLIATTPLLGRVRLSASTLAGSAGDGTTSRGSQHVAVGLDYRPLAQLRLLLAGGVARADRALVDSTLVTTTPVTRPGRSGGLSMGRPTVGGASSYESFPVGSARLVWKKPGDAIAVDLRASRQLLDASPFLVAQGVLRDEASLALDLRLIGPMRVRGFGRVGSVHNADESNGRQIFGGALAYAPAAYEVSLRAQTMRYDAPTALAYFSPRQVNTTELTTYFERETDRGITLAADLGGGAQQVTEWSSSTASSWSPTVHAWTQLVVPLNGALALGTEIEAYDSRVGSDAQASTVGASRWRYVSGTLSLRVRL